MTPPAAHRRTLPAAILAQHIAVLGKTGSGKTSTAKLAIEQVVAEGARVCVLDPIKSDWWGLTSSANGKHAGLPFHILGGPHGHVPLHSAAGKAIADVVANGALPLSIIDMADFEPGGQAKFFVDFAPTLLRKMRGVVYLVIEEAHLFAPKERSGIGAENLSIHWAKTMATAGRSKGVRLVLVTQRTQALHNALLGSCDTLIAHRLTAPADQDPVVKWLKANTSKDVLEQVSGSLASLKTGEGWICSGEAKVFERVHFPRIATYDNTATPTGDGEDREIKTAPVDPEKLRAIIGDAVDKAKADDPRELRKQIAELKRQAEQRVKQSVETASNRQVKTVEKPALTEKDREILTTLGDRIHALTALLNTEADAIVERVRVKVASAINTATTDMLSLLGRRAEEKFDGFRTLGLDRVIEKLTQVQPSTPIQPPSVNRSAARPSPQGRRVDPGLAPSTSTRPASLVSSNGGDPSIGKSGLRRMLIALAQRPQGLTRGQLGVRARVSSKGGSFDTYLSKARVNGWIDSTGDRIVITNAGLNALGSYEPLPEGQELLNHYLREFGSSGAARMLAALANAYPRALTRSELSEQSNVSAAGGSFDTYVSKLRTLELIEGRGELRASEELFS